jgi:endonuclease-3
MLQEAFNLIGDEVVARLRKYFPTKWSQSTNAFGSLIRTILSQNTNFRNEDSAYKTLDRRIGVNPQMLASARLDDVMDSIRSAGLYRNKAPRIIELARIVLEKYCGDLSSLLKKNYGEAREELMTLPGVGMKTADVFLLFQGNKAVIPIDTHIFRISRRLGFAPKISNYDEVRRALEAIFRPEDYRDVHLLLIQLGREVCTARKAKCVICPLAKICPKLI